MKRPSIHVLAYGDFGSWKSRFFSTFPQPILVQMFDPLGKDTPYVSVGEPQGLKWSNDLGIYYQIVKVDGEIAVRIEYYQDARPRKPEAWRAFMDRWDDFDPVEEGYETVIYDSLSFMELRKRHDAQFRTMKSARHQMKWMADATDALEQHLLGTAAALPCNVGLAAHISQEKDELNGNMNYFPAAPGRLGAKGQRLPAGFAEVYRAYIETDKKGRNQPTLQTEKDDKYSACTQIQAPDGCDPTYEALWKNWDRRHK